jgi:hypothetical protein
MGDFVMTGTLSAIPLEDGDPAIVAEGVVTAKSLQTDDIYFTGDVITTFSEPVTATGDFLLVKIKGEQRGIRLWDSGLIRSYPSI